MLDAVLADLAPGGVLRAAINMNNKLLVTGDARSGDPAGVAPSMALAIADRLGVKIRFVPFARPAELANAAGKDLWDIGMIAAEPAREGQIAFCGAYCEISATYLVPAGSALVGVADVDRPGVRIAGAGGSAYELWLSRNIRHARLLRVKDAASGLALVAAGEADALAALRPQLIDRAEGNRAWRILPGQFTAVQQSIGVARDRTAGADFLRAFVEEAKASGLVARLIARHKVAGAIAVAPPRRSPIERTKAEQ